MKAPGEVELTQGVEPCISDDPSSLIMPKEIDGVLLDVLPPEVVAHDGLRIPMLRHHLHLPEAEAGLRRPDVGRPA